ncbi:MAG: serine/threonine-protein kinase [Gemmatales bacterium]|nr:serine/threonine protein kinase [Gemmatales bacterium]MDW7993108.1 serine/threonine-protein kinase [Gemmatales bacterium]
MAVATLEAFFELLRKSGLVEAESLDKLVGEIGAGGQVTGPAQFADLLVRRGVITAFQAEQLLAGRWKGFFISKYKILSRLGSGGMGMVFLAEHKYMKRLVAIKVLPRSRSMESSALERFYREAKAIAALDHPNVVRAYDLDQEGDLHFLVMEYVDGVSLQDLVKAHGPFDVARATHYLYQAARGLHHAYSVGLIHRDIKPANLLVSRAGVVKLLDLGLARFFLDEQDILTRKYDEKVLGTADYLAPEQALDSHVVDIRADIYSLGATFYYVLAGHPLFPEGTVAQKLIWHQTRMPKPIREIRSDVPIELAELLHRMLAKKPAERPQTPEEVARILEPMVDLRQLLPPPGVAMSTSPSAGSAAADYMLATVSSVNMAPSSSRLRSTLAQAGAARSRDSTILQGASSSQIRLVGVTGESKSASPSASSVHGKLMHDASVLDKPTNAPAASSASRVTVPQRPTNSADGDRSAESPVGNRWHWSVWLAGGTGLGLGIALAWVLLRWLSRP